MINKCKNRLQILDLQVERWPIVWGLVRRHISWGLRQQLEARNLCIKQPWKLLTHAEIPLLDKGSSPPTIIEIHPTGICWVTHLEGSITRHYYNYIYLASKGLDRLVDRCSRRKYCQWHWYHVNCHWTITNSCMSVDNSTCEPPTRDRVTTSIHEIQLSHIPQDPGKLLGLEVKFYPDFN